jgi:hypothetical protein
MEPSKRVAMPLLLSIHLALSLAEAALAAYGMALLASGVPVCPSPGSEGVDWRPRRVLVALVAGTWAFLMASW